MSKLRFFSLCINIPGVIVCFFLFVLAQGHFPFSKRRDPLWEAHTGCLHFQASDKNDCFVLFSFLNVLVPFLFALGTCLSGITSLALYLVS
jgi:hypothetical protein